ncbi:MAG TPA: MlaD family protein [Bacteroidota bacterium]|nr:MlaD family protein [Bacteroidota bacterium]
MNATQMRWYSLRVGIVVLIGIIIFVFVISVVGTEQNIFASKYTLKVFIPNVQGLVNGAMVTLGGLKIGYVTDMQFRTRDRVNGVEVTLDLLSKYRSSITTSSVGQIKTIGLLGDKYIDISIGAEHEEAMAENSFVPLKESFDLESAGPQLKSALADFSEVMGNAKRITASIDNGEGSVGRLIKHPTVATEMEKFFHSLNGVMAAVEHKEGTLGKIVYDENMSKNFTDLSSNLKAVTDQIRQGKGTMGKLIMDDQLYTNLSTFSLRADSIMARASSDSSNVSKILTDKNFYNQILSLMNDLNLLLIDLREHPSKYVHVSVF